MPMKDLRSLFGNSSKMPSTQTAVVRPVDQGMRLYPTGNKNGLMWEVKDELGNMGWVSSIMFDLAK